MIASPLGNEIPIVFTKRCNYPNQDRLKKTASGRSRSLCKPIKFNLLKKNQINARTSENVTIVSWVKVYVTFVEATFDNMDNFTG